MSDTENKKPSKGSEHTSSNKKRAAAAAAAAELQDDTKGGDDVSSSPAGTPQNRKRSKLDKAERKSNKLSLPALASEAPDAAKTGDVDEDHSEGSIDTPVVPSPVVVPVEAPADAAAIVKVEAAIVEAEATIVKAEAAIVKVEAKDKLAEMDVGIGIVLRMCSSASKLVSNVVMASKGPLDALATTPRAEPLVLAMITKDMERDSKGSQERGASFTSISFVTLKILDPGFNSAPYEKVEGANTKQLVFCDKKGKMLDKGRPTKLASVSVVDSVRHLDMRTWEQHPSAMMKTKWRGAPTGCVGVISPGIPLTCNIFNENKDSIMENDTTEIYLKPFSIAIIGLAVKSREQCVAGYGIGVRSIKYIEGANVAMTGLYHDAFFYTDSRGILEQSDERLQLVTRVKEFASDLSFVCKLVRSKDELSERPIVCILPTNDASAAKTRKQYSVHMQPNNNVLELEINDANSIYHEKRFRITIPDNMFTIEETGLPWIQFYMQWMLSANACRIMIVHDEYQFKRMSDGTATASMRCALVPDEERLFSDKNADLALSHAVVSSLNERVKGRKNTLDMYTGWVIHIDHTSKKTYAILFDKTKAYGPEIEKPSVETTVVDATEGGGAGDVPGADVGDVVDPECDPAGEHTSIICRIYKGMNPARHIWRGYLLTIDNEKDEVERLFQIGIKSKPAYAKTSSGGDKSANADIFETCDMLFD